MTLQDDGAYKTDPITFEAGQQIVIRANGDWTWYYPTDKYTITEEDATPLEEGVTTRAVVFDPATGTISFVDFKMGSK